MSEAAAGAEFVEVALPVPLEQKFHYQVPTHLLGHLRLGHRVLVPFGRRRLIGFVVGHSLPDPELLPKMRKVEARLDRDPLITEDVLHLALFAASYYLSPLGEVLKSAVPPGLSGGSDTRFVPGRTEPEPALEGAELELFLRASKGKGLKLNEVRGKLAHGLIDRGVLVEREFLAAHADRGEIDVLARVLGGDESSLSRARKRRLIYQMLEKGPRARDEIAGIVGKDALRRALPRLVDDGLVEVRRVARDDLVGDRDEGAGTAIVEAPPLTPTPEQRAVLHRLEAKIDEGGGETFLLHGVTGSGKTEVYLRAISRALAAGRGGLVLVPEIALTPQLEERFRARFGEGVAVLHSAMPDGERRDRFRRLLSGEARIALGPRSALWAPVRNLGLIVVDEEHDPSFKQNSDVRYHARDLALARARRGGAVAILGTATPSLETLHLVETQRIERLTMKERVGVHALPKIEIVDLAEDRRNRKGEIDLLTQPLQDALRDVVESKKQAIIFLNRRGFNTIVHCEECGDARTCLHCDVSLTHHRTGSVLRCHYCGHREPLERACRKCGGTAMQPFGAGTQRVAELIERSIPGARVLRLDRDSTAKRGALEKTLDRFRAGSADVLVGTQMVAKGHDFPLVTLVGIILADASLAFPDFRAAERTFQLLTQVAGRAGRAEHAGRVIVQTFQPEHYAIKAAMTHDVEAFAAIELASRKSANYPPYARMGLIRVDAKNATAAQSSARQIARIADELDEAELRVRGPAPAPIGRVKEHYRFIVMLMASSPARLSHAMGRVKARLGEPQRGINVIFDVDPVDLL